VSRFTARRLGYALGAQISGIDLREPLDDETVAELRKAWLEHVVLCFPAQDLSAAQQTAFCERFGEVDDRQPTDEIRPPDNAGIIVLTNKPITVSGKMLAASKADFWHSDTAYTDRPAVASFLNGKQLPSLGGDTLFVNMYMALETLSPAMQHMLEALEGVQDIGFGRNPEAYTEERKQRTPPTAQPVIRIHPETGRKALYVGGYVRQFVGMTEEESKPLLDFLFAHATRYEFMYRHRWTVNDFLMWDNRCAMHFGLLDYDQRELRRMQRSSILGAHSGYHYDREAVAAGR
jgi:taurine dioxygenase